MTDLGALTGLVDYSYATAINPAGQIVVVDSRGNAVLWDKGATRDLGTLPGGSFSLAFDVYPAGQVVGAAETPIGETHAFIWAKGTMTDLGVLKSREGERRDRESHAFDINPAGEVVGFSGWFPRAFHWAKGVMTELPTLGGRYAGASAINPSGQEGGWSSLSERWPDEPEHAALWTLK